MNTLHVDSILKSYNSKQILTDIYMLCKTGDIIGLLGRNGSGKSTLLKIIFGAINTENSFVKVNNEVLYNHKNRFRYIKYLPQESMFPNHIKVTKLIDLFCDNDKFDEIKTMDCVHSNFNKKVNQLSGGEKRFLENLMVLYSKSKFILIDEPFTGLSPLYKEKVKELIKKEASNKGIIITDHDYRNILDLSTQTLLLHYGKVHNINKESDLKEFGYISGK